MNGHPKRMTAHAAKSPFPSCKLPGFRRTSTYASRKRKWPNYMPNMAKRATAHANLNVAFYIIIDARAEKLTRFLRRETCLYARGIRRFGVWREEFIGGSLRDGEGLWAFGQ